MRFVVVGAGAIGGLVAGRLTQAGNDVLLVARGPHREAIAARGLRIDGAHGPEQVRIPLADDGISLGPGDVVLLAVKSQDTRGALDALPPANVPIVCLQNGVANERAALRRFPRVYGAYVFCPASHLEPGVVSADFTPVEGIIDIGRYPSGVDDVATTVATALDATTFSARTVDDIMRWKYAKLLGNLGNAVQALCAPGDGHAELVATAREEGRAVLAAAGIAWVSDEEQEARREGISGRAGGGRPGGSTWQSLARGAGSIETDYLNGEIVLLGRLHGIPTPVNAALQHHARIAARTGSPPATIPPNEMTAPTTRKS